LHETEKGRLSAAMRTIHLELEKILILGVLIMLNYNMRMHLSEKLWLRDVLVETRLGGAGVDG
jgi:hypothetical protein